MSKKEISKMSKASDGQGMRLKIIKEMARTWLTPAAAKKSQI